MRECVGRLQVHQTRRRSVPVALSSRRVARLFTLVLLAWPFLSSGSSAQFDHAGVPAERRAPRSFGEGTPQSSDLSYPGRGELGVTVGAFGGSMEPGSGSVLVFAPVVEGWYAPADAYGMSIRLPVVQGSAQSGSLSTRDIFFGNVTVGGFWQLSQGGTTLRIGVELATPTSGVSDDVERRPFDLLVYELAAAMRGNTEPWLWAPEHVAPVVPLRLEHRAGPAALVALDAAAAVLVPLDPAVGETTRVVGRLGVEGALVGPEIRLGVRAGAVAVIDGPVQLSAEPFLRWDLDPAFLTAAFTVNLDPPAGFSFHDAGVWGLHVGGGVAFEDRAADTGGAGR